MRKIVLYIASSLNGKIASKDGSVDWLEEISNPEKSDYGYTNFYNSIDTTIQGYSTYDQIIKWGIDFPYADKKNYVITGKKNLNNTKYVEFITSNHIDFVRGLKKQQGKNIWLIGGGRVNSMLLQAELIDEIIVFVMPIVIPEGIGLFESLFIQKQFKLINTQTYASGAVELRYVVE